MKNICSLFHFPQDFFLLYVNLCFSVPASSVFSSPPFKTYAENLKPCSPSQPLEEIDLDTSPFRLQVQAFLCRTMTPKKAIAIGKGLEKLLEVENIGFE
jgi:hypothetical protein